MLVQRGAARNAAHDLADPGHDVFHLAVLGLVIDAQQNRIGASQAHVGGPGGLRVLLVVGHVGQHAEADLLEHRHSDGGLDAGGLVEPIRLVLDDRREERPFVREVVIHQRARNPGALRNLIDADLVVRSLAENFRPQGEQFSASILGG